MMPWPGTQALVVSCAGKIVISALSTSSLFRNNILFAGYKLLFFKTYFQLADLEGQQVATWVQPYWIILGTGLSTCFGLSFDCISHKIVRQHV